MDDVNTLCDPAGEQIVLQILIFVYTSVKTNAFILVGFHGEFHWNLTSHMYSCLSKYKICRISLKVFILYYITWFFLICGIWTYNKKIHKISVLASRCHNFNIFIIHSVFHSRNARGDLNLCTFNSNTVHDVWMIPKKCHLFLPLPKKCFWCFADLVHHNTADWVRWVTGQMIK